MIDFRKLFLIAGVVLSALLAEIPADAPKLTDAQKLQWKGVVQKALLAEIASHRQREAAAKEAERLVQDQQRAAQEAQALAAKLLKEIAACEGAELTIDGDVKCPAKAEPKK